MHESFQKLELALSDRFPENKIVLHSALDAYTFRPYYNIMVDGKNSGVAIMPEAILDATVIHGTAVEDQIHDAIIEEVRRFIEGRPNN